jgi:hypothetical protein
MREALREMFPGFCPLQQGMKEASVLTVNLKFIYLPDLLRLSITTHTHTLTHTQTHTHTLYDYVHGGASVFSLHG